MTENNTFRYTINIHGDYKELKTDVELAEQVLTIADCLNLGHEETTDIGQRIITVDIPTASFEECVLSLKEAGLLGCGEISVYDPTALEIAEKHQIECMETTYAFC